MATIKTKVKSTSAGSFLKGGTTGMFKKSGAAPMPSGISAQKTAPAFSKAPPAAGPPGTMGKQGDAAPAVAGQVTTGGGKGNNNFSVAGGTTKMFGHSGASPAKAR